MKSPRRSAVARRKLSREDLRDQHPDVVAVIGPTLDAEDGETDLLKSIAMALASLRDDAKTSRMTSGVEDIWRKCEEAYIGVDDANRGEFGSLKWDKPTSTSGPLTTNKSGAVANSRSSIYIRLTARYVDAGYAKLAEILLPADDKAFSFKETPVPELIEGRNDQRQVLQDGTGIPLTRPLMDGETPPPQQTPPAADVAQGAMPGAAPPVPGAVPAVPGGPPSPGMAPAPGAGDPTAGMAQPPEQRVPLTVADLAEENIQLARKKAKVAETQIYDWMVETSYRAENRKVLFDSARLGVGVLKGPVPRVIKKMAVSRDKDSKKVKITYQEKVIPESKMVSPWNCFPDPSCGEVFQNGDYFWERDWLSEKQMRDLRDVPGYITSAIEKIIVEGPDRAYEKSREAGEMIEASSTDATKGRYEVWYFHGFLKKDDLNLICQASGYQGDQSETEGVERIPVIATMVNERIIKAVPAPLDSGKIPYRSMPWTRRVGSWAGIGIAEQLFAAQRMLNAATRSMLNNAGKSAGSQIVVDQMSIRPADGQWVIAPDKVWYKTGDSIGSIKDVFELYKITNVTPELMEIIKFALQMAEESTSIPLISQGQTGPNTPETLGAAQIQNTNANQLLRSIGYSYDDHVTEPVVIDYYEWYLLDPEIPDENKGDFSIDSHGSVSMVERAIQDQTIAQMGPLTKDPAFGMDPKRWAKQMIMSKKLDPTDFQYTPEEQKVIDKQPPPEDPRVTVAKITMKGWIDEAAVGAQSDNHKTDVTAAFDLKELDMRREIALLQYANVHKIKITEVQAQLTETAMKLAAQERLNRQNADDQARQAHQDHRVDLHKTDLGHAVQINSETRKHAVDIHKAELVSQTAREKNDQAQRDKGRTKPPAQASGRSANGKSFSQANK